MLARLRLWWFAAVAFVAIFGIGELAIWIGESVRGPNWWAQDFVTYDAARRILDGAPLYADRLYLYPPVGALLGFPFLVLDRFTASLVLAAGKVLIAAACALWFTRGWPTMQRGLAVVALITSLPFLHDLFLGNTNGLVAAAIVPAVAGRSRPRNGVLLGLAGALLAKPLLIPVLLWLVVWRRETALGAMLAGAVATLMGLVMFGPAAYADWFDAVRTGSIWLSTPFAGNHGVTSYDPALWPPVAALVGVLFLVVLVRGGAQTGLIWALASPILLLSYAGTYSALPIALTLPIIGPRWPMLALAIVALSPVATTIPLPFYAAGILLASLWIREPRVAVRDARTPASVALELPPSAT
jgi:hypothetical protein